MELKEFEFFKIKGLSKINGGLALQASYTVVVTDCGGDNEDASYDDCNDESCPRYIKPSN